MADAGGTAMNRREFVCAAAGAALLAASGRLGAQGTRYDLVIRGGRVIDPSLRLDAVRDVGIAAGRIAAVEPAIARRGGRDARRARQARRARPDRHPHATRRATRKGRRCACATASRAGSTRARPGADNIDPVVAIAKAVAATGARARQHRPRRHPARRRHEGLGTRRRRRGARRDRAASRLRRRRQGAAVARPSSARTTSRC